MAVLISFCDAQVFIDSVNWSDGRVWEGSRILGQGEGLYQGCGYDVANLERFVVFHPSRNPPITISSLQASSISVWIV
jgi:hypothetical protein